MIKVLIVDDHAIVRHGLRQMFQDTTDLEVLDEAANGTQAIELARHLAPDVVLLDMTMPGLSGTELIRRLLADNPALKIVVLSMNNEPQLVNRALKAGAAGYVTKDSGQATLFSAIRKVATGNRFIDPALVDAVVFDSRGTDDAPHALLSERELQVLQMLASGLSSGEIAESLFLSAKTISTHKTNLMQKLCIDNNADLVRYAIKHGLARE